METGCVQEDGVTQDQEADRSGDLYVDVRIKSHEFLVRDEDDLFHEMMIPFTLATLGGVVQVPTLDGKFL